jgi:hypothetical protein
MNTKHWIILGVLAAAALVFHGRSWFFLGDTGGRIGVKGTVMMNGEPVERGRIQFTPDQKTSGPVVTGTIVDGKYRIDAYQGVQPGAYEAKLTVGDARDFFTKNSESPRGRRVPSAEAWKWPVPQIIAAGEREVELNFAFPPASR